MNKHTATLDGLTFKRVSQNRVYTHVVVVSRNIAGVRQKTEQDVRATYAHNLPYRTKVANGQEQVSAAEVARCVTLLARGVESLVAERLAEFDNDVKTARNKSSDGLDLLWVEGWCSRRDLAEKLARKAGPRAAIVTATCVTTGKES